MVFLGSYVARVVLAAKHCEQAECDLAGASQTVGDLESRKVESVVNASGFEQRQAETLSSQQAQVRVEIKMTMEELKRIQQQEYQMRSERDAAREDAAMLSG